MSHSMSNANPDTFPTPEPTVQCNMHVSQHASFPSLYGIAPSRSPSHDLYKLLFDEERPQVRQLPRASDTKDGKLDQCPSNDAGVGALGLVAELGFALLYGR